MIYSTLCWELTDSLILIWIVFKGDHEARDPWGLWPGERVGCQIHPQPYYPVQAQCRKIFYSGSAHRYTSVKWRNALSLVIYKSRLSLYSRRQRITYSTVYIFYILTSKMFLNGCQNLFFNTILILFAFVRISCFQGARHWGVTRSWSTIIRVETSPLNMWRLSTWTSMLVSRRDFITNCLCEAHAILYCKQKVF